VCSHAVCRRWLLKALREEFPFLRRSGYRKTFVVTGESPSVPAFDDIGIL
jgi:hypothetical protein